MFRCAAVPAARGRGVVAQRVGCGWWRRIVVAGLVAGVMLAASAGEAHAQGQPQVPQVQGRDATLSVLLDLLRTKGIITEDEYGRLQQALQTPPPSPAADGRQAGTIAAALDAQQATLAALQKSVDGMPKQVAADVLRGKWYERIALRGYTQFRETTIVAQPRVPLEVPADRSVNANESFVIRRGRLVCDLPDGVVEFAWKAV